MKTTVHTLRKTASFRHNLAPTSEHAPWQPPPWAPPGVSLLWLRARDPCSSVTWSEDPNWEGQNKDGGFPENVSYRVNVKCEVHRNSSRSVDGRVYILLSAHRKYYLRKMNWIKRCNFWGNKLVIQLENFLEYLVWWWKKYPSSVHPLSWSMFTYPYKYLNI